MVSMVSTDFSEQRLIIFIILCKSVSKIKEGTDKELLQLLTVLEFIDSVEIRLFSEIGVEDDEYIINSWDDAFDTSIVVSVCNIFIFDIVN